VERRARRSGRRGKEGTTKKIDPQRSTGQTETSALKPPRPRSLLFSGLSSHLPSATAVAVRRREKDAITAVCTKGASGRSRRLATNRGRSPTQRLWAPLAYSFGRRTHSGTAPRRRGAGVIKGGAGTTTTKATRVTRQTGWGACGGWSAVRARQKFCKALAPSASRPRRSN
jgi:hypothetical protein